MPQTTHTRPSPSIPQISRPHPRHHPRVRQIAVIRPPHEPIPVPRHPPIHPIPQKPRHETRQRQPPPPPAQRPRQLQPPVAVQKHRPIRLPQNHHRPIHRIRMMCKPQPRRELTLQRREINPPTPVPPVNFSHRLRAKRAVAIEKHHPLHAPILPSTQQNASLKKSIIMRIRRRTTTQKPQLHLRPDVMPRPRRNQHRIPRPHHPLLPIHLHHPNTL